MKLDEKYLDKVDDSLRVTLEHAADDEPMRVIIILGDTKPNADKQRETILSPSSFESWAEYRQALINQRKEWHEQQFSEARKKLGDASLKLRGGSFSRVIVAEGNAASIARSLSIPEVQKITLDKEIHLPDF